MGPRGRSLLVGGSASAGPGRATRDELAATLECLRQMTESPHPRPREATSEGADPYPVICANLRAALAHLRRAEQAGRILG